MLCLSQSFIFLLLRLLSSISGGVKTAFFLINHFGYIVDNSPFGESFRVFGWNVFIYYYNFIFHLFSDYPWVVRMSYAVILMSGITFLGLMVSMSIDIYRRIRNHKRYVKLKKKYFEKLKEIRSTGAESMSEDELRQVLNYKDRHWARWELSLWTRLLVEVSLDIPSRDLHSSNLQRVAKFTGVYDYLRRSLKSSSSISRKRHAMEVLILTGIKCPSSIVTRLVNDRNKFLRKSARIYYMLTTKDSPTRFFEEENVTMDTFAIWDMMEIHGVFNRLQKTGHRVPTLVPAIKHIDTIDNRQFGAFMMYEIAYWNSEKEQKYLFRYFNSQDTIYRKAAFASMGLRRFVEAEDMMKTVYYKQPDDLQYTILESIFTIGSGRSVSFFAEAFRQSVAVATRLKALSCLYFYGDEGRAMFLSLKAQADKATEKFFKHVEHPLINNISL